MRFSTIALAAAATVNAAGRPNDTSICDYYTTGLLKDNTAENQYKLLTLVVNTVVIGNYTMPNVGVKVPGILAKGNVNGTDVNLAPYFSGALASTNRNDKATCVNFLDGGAAEPLMKNMPANDEKSNQYFLLTHLYQFFGSLLGCSKQGMTGFDAYMGNPSMYKVHKFMNLNTAEFTYFVEQVGMAAASFGVAKEDINDVAMALESTFGMRCAAPAAVIKAQGAQEQAICIASDCMEAKDAMCGNYQAAVAPGNCTSSATSGVAMSTGMPMSSGVAMSSGAATTTSGAASSTSSGAATSSTSSPKSAGAKSNSFGAAAVVAAAAAFAL